jgi:hypothetical protein
VDCQVWDFNGAEQVFAWGEPAERWAELEWTLLSAPICLQASDQAGKIGVPIFDPKATNQALTALASEQGWHAVPVPEELTMFGKDWDAGKGSVLAEWQFSNYPFLWNNVIRTETVLQGRVPLRYMDDTSALVVVTKCGEFPSSNSTLYYEQAHAQLEAVLRYNTFDIPIRLVGLSLPHHAEVIEAMWTTYGGRYARHGESEFREFGVSRGRPLKYGVRSATFHPM